MPCTPACQKEQRDIHTRITNLATCLAKKANWKAVVGISLGVASILTVLLVGGLDAHSEDCRDRDSKIHAVELAQAKTDQHIVSIDKSLTEIKKVQAELAKERITKVELKEIIEKALKQ